MRAAYVDPPYYGCGASHYGKHHADAADFDKLETHAALIERVNAEYDAWALSLNSTTLQDILPLCPSDVRIGSWMKSFASFKPNVNPAYCWEPVIFRGERRKRDRSEPTVQDFCIAPITLKKGLAGAKPPKFCRWVIEMLGLQDGDTLDDLFPGTGAMGREWEKMRQAASGERAELVLFS